MPLALRNLSALALGLFVCIAAWGQQVADTDRPPAILPLESEAGPTLMGLSAARRAARPGRCHHSVSGRAREDHAGIWQRGG